MKKIYHRLLKIISNPTFLIAILSTYSCTPDPGSVITSPKTLPPGIWAFLNTAADSQYVVLSTVLYESSKEDPQFSEVEVPLINKAKVWLAADSKSFTLNPVYVESLESPAGLWDGFMRYWASTEPIRAGESYWLKVSIPGKGEFTASTTAPGDFEILSPNPEDTVDVFNPLEVKWTAAEGAAGYRIDLWEFKEYRNEYFDRVTTGWNNSFRGVFIERSPESAFQFQHSLARFYAESNDPFESDTLFRAVLTIDALDVPAWTAYRIEKDKRQSDSDYRIDPVSYSNIAGGRGLMTASTSKYVELLLPKGQK